jgi:XisI protein
MDRINEYRQIIHQFLENFVKNDLNGQLIFDPIRDRYLVMHNEWRDDYRIYGCAMQLDIIEGQIWIQHNSTEIYIVGEASPVENRELIQLGVFPPDIIFGFRSPSIRKLFANIRSD